MNDWYLIRAHIEIVLSLLFRQGYIFCKILWLGEGGNGAGEKYEKWGSEEKKGKRGKEIKEKGQSDFFINMAHFCWLLYIYVTFHDPLRGKMAAGEKI